MKESSVVAGDRKTFLGKLRGVLLLLGAGIGIVFAILLARRNWKLGRTDRKGALRVAAVQFVLAMMLWIGQVHPIANDTMISLFAESAATWLFPAALVWLLYLALEPAVRSRWPHSIVTWNRILAGRWLDAQVGSHVLIGATAAGVLWIGVTGLEAWLDRGKEFGASGSLFFASGTRQWIGGHAAQLSQAVNLGLIGFFAIFGLRSLLKKDVFAAIVASLLFTVTEGGVANSPNWKLKFAIFFVVFAILIFLLLRVGLVATISAIFFLNGISVSTVATDWKTWYAPYGIATLLLLTGVAVFAFWRSLGSRELLGDGAPS